jgi:predicted translin family RNA/ssDNA-binding protein
MKREEAIELLREIVKTCKNIDFKHISLKPPSEKANADSEGFELHVKNQLNEADWKCLKGIVQTRGLSVKEHDGWIIIHTARQRV